MITITIYDDEIEGSMQELAITVEGGKSLNKTCRTLWCKMCGLMLSWRRLRKRRNDDD